MLGYAGLSLAAGIRNGSVVGGLTLGVLFAVYCATGWVPTGLRRDVNDKGPGCEKRPRK